MKVWQIVCGIVLAWLIIQVLQGLSGRVAEIQEDDKDYQQTLTEMRSANQDAKNALNKLLKSQCNYGNQSACDQLTGSGKLVTGCSPRIHAGEQSRSQYIIPF